MADIIKVASGTCEECEHNHEAHKGNKGCKIQGCDCKNLGTW